MAQIQLLGEWQEAERQAAEAAAAYAVAVDEGRPVSVDDRAKLQALRDDAAAKLRALVERLKQV